MAKQGKSLGSKVGLKVPEPLKLTEYEKQRNLTIEKNALKFKELGMEKLANDLLAKVKSLQQKTKKKHKIIELKDQDYVHDEDLFDDDDDSEQEFFEVPSNEIEETNELVETLTKSISKKMDDATIESANLANPSSEEPLASTAAAKEHAGIENPPQPPATKKRPSKATSDGAEKKNCRLLLIRFRFPSLMIIFSIRRVVDLPYTRTLLILVFGVDDLFSV